jgi:hypothetical protein
MEEKVFISIIEKEEGLEVRVNEAAYGNLPIIGLLEKIKMNLLAELPEENKKEITATKLEGNQKYDA